MAPQRSSRLRRRAAAPGVELALIVAEANRGWILDAICQEVATRARATHVVHYDDGRPLPAAGCYFFSHPALFLDHRREIPRGRRAVVCFTHPSYPPEQAPQVAGRLAAASAVVAICTLHRDGLVAAGLPAAKVSVAIPGADPDRFPPHARGQGAVGLCSAYYPRKAPGTVLGLVRALPHRQFRLLGRRWEQWDGFAELSREPNFTYLEGGYDAYPDFYAGTDVFVSTSRLEGGPVPLLEAMMANAVPVATATGFAPDLIVPGGNGFLCPVDAPPSAFATLVEDAFRLEGDVRATVVGRTWDAFARHVLAVANVPCDRDPEA